MNSAQQNFVRKLILLTGSLLGVCLILFAVNIIKPKGGNRFHRYKIRNKLGISCLDYKQPVFSKRLNNLMPDYIKISSITGIKKSKDEKEILEIAARGKLVEIKDGNGYFIEEMSHSYPYLTRDARDLLMEINRNFKDKISGTKLRGSRFKITSMTRTTEKLQSLRANNSNASLNSSHFYGNAFDISYIKFSTRKFFLTNCDKKYFMEALAEVIWKLKQEKKCWATYEIKQNCFHVIAR